MSPLPFAPPPRDSNLYQQLESTTLQTLTADQLDTIRAKTFSQGTEGNEDEYRRLLLLGLASDQLSLSGPMPNTGEIATAQITVNSTDYTMKAPAAGEVYQVVGISAVAAGSLSSLSGITLYIKLDDGSENMTVLEWSGSGSIEPPDTSYNVPLMFDNNLTLKGRIYIGGGLGAGEEVKISAAIIRVR